MPVPVPHPNPGTSRLHLLISPSAWASISVISFIQIQYCETKVTSDHIFNGFIQQIRNSLGTDLARVVLGAGGD